MASNAPIMGAPTCALSNGWIRHDGRGRPVPVGTLVEVRRFNGDVERIAAGSGRCVRPDGRSEPNPFMPYNAWDYADGGPMAPKFRAYRLANAIDLRKRATAIFHSWLDVRQLEPAAT